MKVKYLKTIAPWALMMLLISTSSQSSVALANQEASKKLPISTVTPGTIKNLQKTDKPGSVINNPNFPHPGGEAPEKQTSRTRLISLAMAKQIALENNPSLAAARERVVQAREAIAQARAAYLPTLSTISAWNYTEKTSDFTSGNNENLYSNKISATQLLFDGFLRKYATLAATYSKKMSLAAQQDAQRLLAWSVAQSFLTIQLARENVKIAESDMAFNQNQEKEALAREKSGTGSLSDLLNFKTRVNTARAFLISSQQDLKESCHGLAALMGYANAQFPESMDIGPLDIQAISPETWDNENHGKEAYGGNNMDNFLARRPDLIQAEYAVKAAGAQINVAVSGYYPTVALTGSYGLSSGEEFRDMGDTDKMGAAVGVTVNFELFSGGATKSSVREARSAKKELEKNLESSKLTAMSDIKSAADDINTTQRQLALQRENTDLVEKMRDLVEKEYTAGQASLVRLNEVQNDLVGALGDLAIARVSLILALERFDYYAGNNID
jgi:TolC family type I secretion outer membrane protein